jgi:hypothetical protein
VTLYTLLAPDGIRLPIATFMFDTTLDVVILTFELVPAVVIVFPDVGAGPGILLLLTSICGVVGTIIVLGSGVVLVATPGMIAGVDDVVGPT